MRVFDLLPAQSHPPVLRRPGRMDISCGHHLREADSTWNDDQRKVMNPADFKATGRRDGWGTWIPSQANFTSPLDH